MTQQPATSTKPTFEQWLAKAIEQRGSEANTIIKGRVFYYGVMTELAINVTNLRKLSEKPGTYSEDDPEFEKIQREWWFCYGQINVMRSFMLTYYQLNPPNWAEDILPDREYVGCLLSEEDFRKYVVNPPKNSGWAVQKAECVDTYTPLKAIPGPEDPEADKENIPEEK